MFFKLYLDTFSDLLRLPTRIRGVSQRRARYWSSANGRIPSRNWSKAVFRNKWIGGKHWSKSYEERAPWFVKVTTKKGESGEQISLFRIRIFIASVPKKVFPVPGGPWTKASSLVRMVLSALSWDGSKVDSISGHSERTGNSVTSIF